MKKLITAFLCALFTIIFATGCVVVSFDGADSVSGRGDLERFEFKTGEITQIRVNILCDINYHSTSSDTVTLDIQPNLMDYVRVEESGGVLTLRNTRPISVQSNSTPVLTISTPSLDTVTLSGAGKFTANDTIRAQSFTISFSGAGALIADLDVDYLDVVISGAGITELTGRADTAEFRMSGAGAVEALGLQTKYAKIDLSGAGAVSVACSDTLQIIASGMGSVEYKGSPSLDINRSGLVTINAVD